MLTGKQLKQKEQEIEANHVALGEECKIVFNYVTRFAFSSCEHYHTVEAIATYSNEVKTYRIYDAVVIAYNQGGHDCTVTCIKCANNVVEEVKNARNNNKD
jgi:hypothetical protein